MLLGLNKQLQPHEIKSYKHKIKKLRCDRLLAECVLLELIGQISGRRKSLSCLIIRHRRRTANFAPPAENRTWGWHGAYAPL